MLCRALYTRVRLFLDASTVKIGQFRIDKQRDKMATVLIVEDDVFVNMEAIFIVKELGHVTLCAYDVDQALAILQAEGHIDLLFTDIRLKNQHVGGFEVAKQAVYLRPEICVLYTSGGDLSGHSEGMVLDGSHFLQKPYGDMQLQASLAFALQAAPVRRPAVATELSISGKELPDDRHNHR